MKLTLPLLCVLFLACQAKVEAESTSETKAELKAEVNVGASSEKAVVPASPAKPLPVEGAKAPVVKRLDPHMRGGPLDWSGPVQWKAWDEAVQSGKPMVLLVYTETCPRCRELAPAFNDAELGALSEKVAMVRVVANSRPPFLERFSHYGGYVPRLFILEPGGEKVREDLTSGHPRFPYFYTPGTIARLKSNLAQVVK